MKKKLLALAMGFVLLASSGLLTFAEEQRIDFENFRNNERLSSGCAPEIGYVTTEVEGGGARVTAIGQSKFLDLYVDATNNPQISTVETGLGLTGLAEGTVTELTAKAEGLGAFEVFEIQIGDLVLSGKSGILSYLGQPVFERSLADKWFRLQVAVSEGKLQLAAVDEAGSRVTAELDAADLSAGALSFALIAQPTSGEKHLYVDDVVVYDGAPRELSLEPPADTGGGITQMLFEDDFEDMQAGDKIIGSASGNWSEVRAGVMGGTAQIIEVDGRKAAEIAIDTTGNPDNGNHYIKRNNIPLQQGRVTFECMVKAPNETENDRNDFIFQNNDGFFAVIWRFRAGNIYLGDGSSNYTTLMKYEAGAWYRMVVTVDVEKKVFDFTVVDAKGKPTAKQLPFTASTNLATQESMHVNYSLYTYKDTGVMSFILDDVKIYLGEPDIPPVQKSGFSDVDGHKNEEAITYLTGKGVIEGYNDGTFKPDNPVTRAEFVTMVTKAFEIASEAPASDFADVPDGHWAKASVDAAVAEQLVNGYGDGTFGPDDNVQYSQTNKVLVELLGYGNSASDLGAYPTGYNKVASERGLTTLLSATSGNATRADVAQEIYNAVNLQDTLFVSPAKQPEHTEFQNNVFVEGDPVSVKIRLEGASKLADIQELPLEIKDYNGKTVETVTVPVTAEGKALTASYTPADPVVGWYSISIPSLAESTFTATLDPSYDRGNFLSYCIVPKDGVVRSMDSPFGVDAAIVSSSSLSPSQSGRLSDLAGVSWVRDRMPTAGSEKFKMFTTLDSFDLDFLKECANEVTSRGMYVLQVFQDSPPFTLSEEEKAAGAKMPSDLMSIYQFAEKMSRELKDDIHAIEIWNEHDIAHFGDRPPDHLAALTKAYALGFMKGNPDLQRLYGPMARDPRVLNYAETAYKNGIAAYLDGFSVHSYSPFEGGSFENVIDVHEELKDQYGFAGKDSWITEVSLAFTRSGVPDFQTRTLEQIDYQAEAFCKLMERGYAHVFPFLLRPYVSGTTQFGLFRQDMTPFPVYQGLAAMTHLLGEANYLGVVESASGEAYVFDTGTTEAVLLLPGDVDSYKIEGYTTAIRAYNAVGTPIDISTDGTITLDGSPVYLIGTSYQSKAVQRVEYPVPDQATVEQNMGVTADTDLTVVMFANFARDAVNTKTNSIPMESWDGLASNWSPRGYLYTPGGTVNATFRVYNFDETAKDGTVTFEPPAGFTVTPATQEVHVEPMSYAEFDIAITASDSAQDGTIMVRGTFGGKPVSPVAFQMLQ